MEYSRSGSKEWSSLRTTRNYTEIKNLQVNTLYTVRVSIFQSSFYACCHYFSLSGLSPAQSSTTSLFLKSYHLMSTHKGPWRFALLTYIVSRPELRVLICCFSQKARLYYEICTTNCPFQWHCNCTGAGPEINLVLTVSLGKEADLPAGNVCTWEKLGNYRQK